MSEDDVRERTIRWSDPLVTARRIQSMSGLDALRALIAGEVPAPPIVEMFGIRMQSADVGVVRMSIVPHESHYNLLGMVHGGAMATLLDTVMGCAVQSTLSAGRGYTTLTLSVNYVRPIKLTTGEVFAEGTIVHAGRTTAIAHGRVVDAAGKLYATGNTTCLLFDSPVMETPAG